MTTIIKPIGRDEFPFRRYFRNQKPTTRTIFTNLGVNSNESDLAALQSQNMLMSVEDLDVLVSAQSEVLPASAGQIYLSTPAGESQTPFDFTPRTAAGSMVNQET